MKIFWNIIGVLLILAGGVWFLQGINVMGGSAMSGHSPRPPTQRNFSARICSPISIG